MRNSFPIAIASLAIAACATAPPLPGFGVEVSVKPVAGGRQVCIAGKSFTPDALVETGYVDIPGRSAPTPAQSTMASHDGDFRVVDINTDHAACTPEQMTRDVVVFAKDLSNGNIAVGKLPARLWCLDVLNAVPLDARCP